MGTQQLLLIVLGVIIVGIAIAVGISIFNNQSYNSNQQAVASECQGYGSMVVQWWKTPREQGGAGGAWTVDSVTLNQNHIATFIGFLTAAGAADTDDYLTTTGKFTITNTASTDTTVTITGCGKEKKGDYYPLVTTTVDLVTGEISSVVDKTDTYTSVTQ